jgi:hypothetical protein
MPRPAEPRSAALRAALLTAALAAALAASSLVPRSAHAQGARDSVRAKAARDSVVATVNEFFRAMTANDAEATRRVMLADGQYYATRQDGDSVRIQRVTNASYFERIAGSRDTMVERIWNPTVLVHGPIATVWAPYDIHRNGQFVHCGVDAFSLIRTAQGWQIAGIVFTMEPKGCAPSPLGPLPKR